MIGLILAAAGSSQRFGGDAPKQFVSLDEQPLYLRSLQPFLEHVDDVALVVPQSRVDDVRVQCAAAVAEPPVRVVAGGPLRQDSVQRGLEALDGQVATVLVHDAARPFVSPALVERVLEGALRHGACVPAVEVGDTVKEVDGGWVVRTLDRDRLRLAQTPQGFGAELLRGAFRRLSSEPAEVTDEAALVERFGHRVAVVEGERSNFKVTWPGDLRAGGAGVRP